MACLSKESPLFLLQIILSLADLIVKPISYVYEEYCTITIYVCSCPTIATFTGPYVFPEVNYFPKVATITPFCLRPKILLFQPSP